MAAFWIVTLCVLLSFGVCAWKKCLRKDKDKKKGKEKSKAGDFDTENDGRSKEVHFLQPFACKCFMVLTSGFATLCPNEGMRCTALI